MPESIQNLVVRTGIEHRLSAMIQLATVSAEVADTGDTAFRDFEELLSTNYPMLHSELRREKITEYGILYHWEGENSQDPVVLMAHYDVVPVDLAEPWRYDPFAGVIEAGIVWGRGALDDKGPLITLLEAVENLLQTGYRPKRDIYISLGGNEETHGYAAKKIADTLKDRGIVPWLVLDEGGAVVEPVFPAAKGDFAMIGIAEKGVADVKLEVMASGGHASTPAPDSAPELLAKALLKVTESSVFKANLSKPVLELLTKIGETADGVVGAALRNINLSKPLVKRMLLDNPETAALLKTTVAITGLKSGTAHNVLASQASATLNIRIIPGETVSSVLDGLEKAIGDTRVTVSLIEGSDPSPVSDASSTQFELIATALQHSYPNVTAAPYVMMQATDSRWFHRYFDQVFRFAPIKMVQAQRKSIHGVNEYVAIDSLIRGEKFYRSLITRL